MPQKYIQDSTHDFPLDASQGLDDLTAHEWLLTNGSGAYAMGTAPGINTRRYHGLFIACQQPPVGRTMLVNQMLARIVFKDQPDNPVELGACAFQDDNQQTVHAPQGHKLLTRFQKGALASWTAHHPRFEMLWSLRVPWKKQAAVLEYTFTAQEDVTLSLTPMVTLRDFHAMRYASQDHGLSAQVSGDTVRYTSHHAKAIISAPGATATWNTQPQQWWYNVYYAEDNDRGQEDREDYYTPAQFTYVLPGNQTHHLKLFMALGHEPFTLPQPGQERRRKGGRDGKPKKNMTPRMEHLLPSSKEVLNAIEPACKHLPDVLPQQLAATLTIAADDFVVDRIVDGQTLSTILAGYPWFADWGRDTFIALPGLLLCTGRHEEAKNVLHAFASNIKDGLVPNRFDDYSAQDIHYNTVDASLWFIQAALSYMDATDDKKSWRDWLADACKNIITAYMQGTHYDIHMTGDGLISAGSKDTQLTWMDAACNGVVFTPRFGKAVEINALWYSSLMGMIDRLKKDDADTARHYEKIAGRVNRAFGKTFWNDAQGCLYDHIWTDGEGNDHADASIRPNQVLAASLPFSPMPKTRSRKMLAVVREKLLTPVGLRTLPQDDAQYHPRYTGPAMQRDEAYHQGTIWPWLLGPFVQANLRVEGFSAKACKQAAADVTGLVDFIMTQSPGQLYEIHEAEEPYRPVGCPAQAWSVAQLIQTLSMIKTK